MAASFSVSGKTAIVTGAGSGINLKFTEILLTRGCNVVLADLSLRPEAKELVSRFQTVMEGSPRARAVYVETDVTSWTALERMFSVALAEFGDFDVVCPGAGVYEPLWSNFWQPPGSEASRDAVDSGRYAILDINLTHPIRVTQLAISHWLYPQAIPNSAFPIPKKVSTSNPKRIIHIASVASQVPVFRAPLYGASKFAISGFIRSIGPLEDAYGIRVNAVAPGVVRTPIWLESPEKLMDIDEAKDTWVTADEVAEAMLQCVQDEDRMGEAMLEIGAAGRTRKVETYNDPGPDRRPEAGLMLHDDSAGIGEVHKWLQDETVWGRRAAQLCHLRN